MNELRVFERVVTAAKDFVDNVMKGRGIPGGTDLQADASFRELRDALEMVAFRAAPNKVVELRA